MKFYWQKWVGNTSFQDWADEINADENFESDFDANSAFDHMACNTFLNIGKVDVNSHHFYMMYSEDDELGFSK